MSLKSVGKNIVENQIRNLSQAGASKAVEEVADKHYKMANGFFSEKNFSISYYCYYQCLKEYATIIVTKNLKTSVKPEEALMFLVKKKKFGLSKKEVEELEKMALKVLNRESVDRKSCLGIKKHIIEMRKSV